MNRLMELRKKKGLTQAEFGRLWGASQNTVSNWENGNREVSTDLLMKFAEYYGVSLDYLLGRDKEEKNSKQKAKESLSRQFGREKEGLIENMLDRLERLTPEQLDQLERYIRFLEQEGK